MVETSTGALNKEMIAARMFRQIVRYWEAKDTDIDNLDPLVRLLIEACAVEIYRINNEIQTAQENMLEKLARLLTPEVHTAPRPAHAVVHARPVEPAGLIYPEMQFFCQKRVPSKPNGPLDTTLDVFFSPAGKYRVLNAGLKFMASGNWLYSINRGHFKEQFLKTIPGKKIDPFTLWIGVELDYVAEDIKGASFFFDLRNHPAKYDLLPLISYSEWFIGGERAEVVQGLMHADTGKPEADSYEGFDEFNLNQLLDRTINQYYRQQFITITGHKPGQLKLEKYPAELTAFFSQGDLAKLQQNMLWMRIKMLPEFDEVVLEDLTICMNCFPVMNRHLNEVRYRLQNNFNIVPLLSNEQFLSVHTVEGAALDENVGTGYYTHLPFEILGEKGNKGSYALRTGDLERFDSRNATEYLNYLLELLRDESHAFAAFGQDFVASLVKELNQNINLLEQKLKQNISVLNREPTYLLVNPRDEGETIFVNYWTTNGEEGNLIRNGTKLDLYEGADIQAESLLLVSGTSGGADRLKNTEILNAYKNALITRGRIVTPEDVKSFCGMVLGKRATGLEIKKGVAISSLPNEGLISTTDIIITPDPAYNIPEEWQGICHELLTRLKQQSAIHMNYRVIIKETA